MKSVLLALIFLFLPPRFALGVCQLTISRPVLNYGRVHEKNYVAQFRRWKILNERELQLTALCEEPAEIAIFTDGGDQPYGLRFATDSLLNVIATNALLDGKSVMLGKTLSHAPFVVRGITRDKKLILNHQGIMPMEGERIAKGRKFTVTLKIFPGLSEKDTAVKDSTTLEANLHFSVETQ